MAAGKYFSWQMTEPGKLFRREEQEITPLDKGEAWVRVAGCGVCHTDISFWSHGVQTRHPLPLTLGHEISGTVVHGPPSLRNKPVIVPAVLPCGKCELCRKGRSNICRNQKMPGNDFHGGFASHIKVPVKYLCPVPSGILKKFSLPSLSVIADAVSTPYQALRKAELRPGDFVVMIGIGGVGLFGALLAKGMGARVLAIDVNPARIEMAKEYGIDRGLDSRGKDMKTIREEVRRCASELGVSPYGGKVFEFSGTKAGQELAFHLLSYASVLSIVGFTRDKVEVRLSNLMAFDAAMIGTWGCRPELYPEVIRCVEKIKIPIGRFVDIFPLSSINEVFTRALEHKYDRRPVLVPDETA